MSANYKHSEAEAYFDTLTPESILATLHANREARRAQGTRIIDKAEPSVAHPVQADYGHSSRRDDYNAMHLREGVALADRLIAARGGKPRQRIEFWHYLAEWQEGRDVLRPTEE